MITAVLLGLEDEELGRMAFPAFTHTIKMAVAPRISAERWLESEAPIALTIRYIEFDYDAIETAAAQLIDPALVIYRRRRL